MFLVLGGDGRPANNHSLSIDNMEIHEYIVHYHKNENGDVIWREDYHG